MVGLELFIACYKVGFWRVFAQDLIKNHPRTQDNDYTLPDSQQVKSQQAVIECDLISVSHPADPDPWCTGRVAHCIPMEGISESLTELIRHVFCHFCHVSKVFIRGWQANIVWTLDPCRLEF